MTIKLNLLPWRDEERERRIRIFYSGLFFSAVFSGFIVLCAHIWIQQEITFQNELNQYLKNEIVILDKKIAEIDGIQKEKERLLARMDIIQELQGNRPHIVHLFDAVARSIPKGLYLTNLNRSSEKVIMDGKAESNTRVSTFMRNIEVSEWLEKPALSVIQADKQQNASYIDFHLEALEVEKTQ